MTENESERSDQASDQEELRFSREQGFFDKSPTIRLLVGFAFALSLFIFLHFQEVRVEFLEINSVTPRYVVAQTDFDFPDDEATLILRQESVRDIGKIFKLSDKQIVQRIAELENSLLYHPGFQEESKNLSFDELDRILSILQRALVQMRFTDSRTLQRMQQVGMDIADYEVLSISDPRNELVLPNQIWADIQRQYLDNGPIPQEEVQFILKAFFEKSWKVEEDIPAQRILRKRIQSTIPERYTHIEAGNRIIDKGERVTSRHLAMLQAMKKALGEKRNLWSPTTILGSVMMTLLFTVICVIYLRVNHPRIYASNRKMALLVTIVILTLIIGKAVEYLLLTTQDNLYELVEYPLFVPFAAILTRNLMNARIATFVSGLLTVIFFLEFAFASTGFMVANLVASLIAILSTHSLRKRKEIFTVCGKAWLGSAVVILSLSLYENRLDSLPIVGDLFSSALFMLLTAISVLGVLPLLESTFSMMSDVSLMEYIDPNHVLLRRLAFEAPGTYQHTLVVCNIAEAAALAIGANGLFCRVATLYHDVGKVINPYYFTENQQGEMNIHQLLTPLESAQAIMSHVSEGVALARKAGLPDPFIDIIKQHHGTTLVYYFYRKQLDKVGGDPKLVNQQDFRYAGPKPRSKEAAIIMIADSLEAASRSLDHANEAAFLEMANDLIRFKAEDGQFDECFLTFQELNIVKKTMVKMLVAALHSRVKYPKREPPILNINA